MLYAVVSTVPMDTNHVSASKSEAARPAHVSVNRFPATCCSIVRPSYQTGGIRASLCLSERICSVTAYGKSHRKIHQNANLSLQRKITRYNQRPDAKASQQHLTQTRHMKVLSSLASVKRRHADCQIVKRKGTLYVICKSNPKFKARQGATAGTRLSKKGVK